ncbi:hypothetical protein [Kiloniella majae]|uniref:hypothetical protein n=1 Tax=Kiloniella majae TaxID=1938558 RepID=UPI000A278B3C|nr:hypothetical protein [Kiloniella majae]
MRKYAEILCKQAQELIAIREQNNEPMSDDDLKAIKRIKWIMSSLVEKETEGTVLYKGDVDQIKEDIRNQKLDADEKLYRQLLGENKRCLERISPDSLVRYVPLLEIPE